MDSKVRKWNSTDKLFKAKAEDLVAASVGTEVLTAHKQKLRFRADQLKKSISKYTARKDANKRLISETYILIGILEEYLASADGLWSTIDMAIDHFVQESVKSLIDQTSSVFQFLFGEFLTDFNRMFAVHVSSIMHYSATGDEGNTQDSRSDLVKSTLKNTTNEGFQSMDLSVFQEAAFRAFSLQVLTVYSVQYSAIAGMIQSRFEQQVDQLLELMNSSKSSNNLSEEEVPRTDPVSISAIQDHVLSYIQKIEYRKFDLLSAFAPNQGSQDSCTQTAHSPERRRSGPPASNIRVTTSLDEIAEIDGGMRTLRVAKRAKPGRLRKGKFGSMNDMSEEANMNVDVHEPDVVDMTSDPALAEPSYHNEDQPDSPKASVTKTHWRVNAGPGAALAGLMSESLAKKSNSAEESDSPPRSAEPEQRSPSLNSANTLTPGADNRHSHHEPSSPVATTGPKLPIKPQGKSSPDHNVVDNSAKPPMLPTKPARRPDVSSDPSSEEEPQSHPQPQLSPENDTVSKTRVPAGAVRLPHMGGPMMPPRPKAPEVHHEEVEPEAQPPAQTPASSGPKIPAGAVKIMPGAKVSEKEKEKANEKDKDNPSTSHKQTTSPTTSQVHASSPFQQAQSQSSPKLQTTPPQNAPTPSANQNAPPRTTSLNVNTPDSPLKQQTPRSESPNRARTISMMAPNSPPKDSPVQHQESSPLSSSPGRGRPMSMVVNAGSPQMSPQVVNTSKEKVTPVVNAAGTVAHRPKSPEKTGGDTVRKTQQASSQESPRSQQQNKTLTKLQTEQMERSSSTSSEERRSRWTNDMDAALSGRAKPRSPTRQLTSQTFVSPTSDVNMSILGQEPVVEILAQRRSKSQNNMGPSDEAGQEKAIVDWLNKMVKSKGSKVQSLDDDFSDGVVLMDALEAATKKEYRWNRKPTLLMQKIDNLNVFLKEAGVPGAVAEDIVNKDRKRLLVLLSNFMKKYTNR